MKEADFWKLVKSRLPLIHWQRMETGSTGRGVPDVNGCFEGQEFWIELKVTNTKKVALRPEQVAWHLLRARAKGKTYILVKAKKGIYLFAGKDAKEVLDEGLNAEALAVYQGSFSDWCHLFWVLTGCYCEEDTRNGQVN